MSQVTVGPDGAPSTLGDVSKDVTRDPAEDPAGDWPGVRLHVVTGKGGTGKSTVAAALALALASRGQQVLLCEVEGRQGIAQLFDVPPLPYEERRIASGDDRDGEGGEVYALAIEPEAALLEYLSMYYRLGRAGKALDRFGVIDFATTIAPGVRDVLLTGKVYEAVHRNKRGKNQREYDAVVLDAPPTGRIAQFLNVNSELAGPRQGRPDPRPGRLDHEAAALRPDPGPPGHRARGHAGAGDRRRHRRAAPPTACRWAASWSTWCATGSSTPPPAGGRSRTGCRATRSRPTS